MAVGPSNLEKRIRENSGNLIKEAEGRIDQYLEENYEGILGPRVLVPKDMIDELPSIAKQTVLENYRQAGWHVRGEGENYSFAIGGSVHYTER